MDDIRAIKPTAAIKPFPLGPALAANKAGALTQPGAGKDPRKNLLNKTVPQSGPGTGKAVDEPQVIETKAVITSKTKGGAQKPTTAETLDPVSSQQ